MDNVSIGGHTKGGVSAAIDRLNAAALDAQKYGMTVVDARRIVDAETLIFSNNVHVLHKAGVLMRNCGELNSALEYFQKALKIHPNFHFTEVEIGDVYATFGDEELALNWYRLAIKSEPNFQPAYFKAAQIEKNLKRPWLGLELLQQWHEIEPNELKNNLMRADFLQYLNMRDQQAEVFREIISFGVADDEIHFRYIRTLTEIGQYANVIAHVANFVPKRGSWFDTLWAALSGHARLALSVDVDSMARVADQREKSTIWRDGDGVLAELKSAIKNKQPYSLIRLGDGEARFITYFDNDAKQVIAKNELEAILDVHWDNWFRQRLADVQDRLPSLFDEFRNAISSADIIGVPTGERYIRDNIHRGYFDCQDRFLASQVNICTQKKTTAFIHRDLHHLSPFYSYLLNGLDFVGLVSPHIGLAEKLAKYHNIPSFREWLIPGETRLPQSARGQIDIPHFPDRFYQLISELDIPSRGAVVLVAAGLLGKIYCKRIKEIGGIALDIGAIVDAWTGFRTRPGEYEPPESWVLP